MRPVSAIPQLRTTDLDGTIRFYTEVIGLGLALKYRDFYAGLQADGQCIHLKQVDEPDPSIAYVTAGEHLYLDAEDSRGLDAAIAAKRVPFAKPVYDTSWERREFAIQDGQGHTFCFGERI